LLCDEIGAEKIRLSTEKKMLQQQIAADLAKQIATRDVVNPKLERFVPAGELEWDDEMMTTKLESQKNKAVRELKLQIAVERELKEKERQQTIANNRLQLKETMLELEKDRRERRAKHEKLKNDLRSTWSRQLKERQHKLLHENDGVTAAATSLQVNSLLSAVREE
jgi:Txe/YoeB family toxin of Txe-Axe toxin-antitoxin module